MYIIYVYLCDINYFIFIRTNEGVKVAVTKKVSELNLFEFYTEFSDVKFSEEIEEEIVDGVDQFRTVSVPTLVYRSQKKKDKLVLITLPDLYPNENSDLYPRYCEFALKKFKSVIGDKKWLLDGLEEDSNNPTDADWIRSWETFKL